MMATPCKPQCFLNQRLSFRLLSLVMIATWLFSVTESSATITVKGEVGGNVSIVCPIKGPFEFFYLQRGDEFVNGYHSKRNLTVSPDVRPWPNTRVDVDNTTVHIYNLNMSHRGDYVCHIYQNDVTELNIHLNLTAKFTKPEVKMSCNRLSCMVTCSSYGGYPENKMTWSVPGSPVWMEVNSSMLHDQKTMMISGSITAYFNCSNGQLDFIRCSVGEVTSDMFSVCTPLPPPGNDMMPIIISVVLIAAIIIMATLLLLRQCKTRQTGPVAAEVRQEWGGHGKGEEEIELNSRAS